MEEGEPKARHRFACRFVWNGALRANQDARRMAMEFGGRPPSPSYFNLSRAFTALRRNVAWLQELPYKPVRYTLKRQADAWQGFFEGRADRPRFKARSAAQGFALPEDVRIKDGCIAVPKLGRYRLRRRGGNPHPDGVPKQAVFTRENGKWYCTVFLVVAVEAREDGGSIVGVDRNVGQCATSDGHIHHLPTARIERLEVARKRHQRRAARQVKGSNRRKRTLEKAARKARTARNIRSNYAHQTSRRIADSAHTVVLEALNVKAMTSSARGTVENPGKGLRRSRS